MNADGYAKIELGTLRVIQRKMDPSDLRRAVKIAKDHNVEFERKWDEFFSR